MPQVISVFEFECRINIKTSFGTSPSRDESLLAKLPIGRHIKQPVTKCPSAIQEVQKFKIIKLDHDKLKVYINLVKKESVTKQCNFKGEPCKYYL